MSDNSINSSNLFSTLLLIVFITLKLCKVIDWSWWWILSPIWIPLFLALVVFIGVLIWKGRK